MNVYNLEIFQVGFLFKSNLRISTAGKHIGIILNKQFLNDNIFNIIDQIKVLRVPLWIVHIHRCLKFTWNYAYSPFNPLLQDEFLRTQTSFFLSKDQKNMFCIKFIQQIDRLKDREINAVPTLLCT